MLQQLPILWQPQVKITDFELSDQSPSGGIRPWGANQKVSPFPSPVQLTQWVTFEESPEEDARAEEPHLPTWGDNEGTGDPSDWSKIRSQTRGGP